MTTSLDLWSGPWATDRASRMHTVDRIVRALHARYGPELLGIALYGSLGRGADGPFSDVELFCILHDPAIDEAPEWIYGAGRAEVNLLGLAVAERDAQEVDEYWALSKGQFLRNRPLYGDPALFARLRQLALSPPKAAFDGVVVAMLVGEFYEWMGKLRNARHAGDAAGLAALGVRYAEYAALLLGLVHRRCYMTGMTMLAESLTLPALPPGYEALARLVIAGDLRDANRLSSAIESLWANLGSWVVSQGVDLSPGVTWPWES